MAKENNIKLKATDITQAFLALREVSQSNDQPFKGQAKRLLWEMQSEVKFIQSVSQEDLEAIDKDIEFGEKIVAPQYYPDEYKPILEKVCKELPEKKSKVEQLMEK